MQLRLGKLRGTLSHAGIGDFGVGSFNLSVRARRTPSERS